MGQSASKVATKAKNAVKSPAMTMPSARSPTAPPTTATRTALPKMSESRDAGIMQDGQDPSFMANLNSLGQVKVPHSNFAFRTDNGMIDILQRRKANEQAVEATSRPNQISARTLSNLMDERKTAKSEQEMRNIAKEYQLDFELLEDLARHYNAPSIAQQLPPKSVEDDTETHLACWADPEWTKEQAKIAP